MRLVRLLAALAMIPAWAPLLQAQPAPPAAHAYRHFRAAIYITVGDTKALADRATFERQYARIASQLPFDKVYVEAYRDRLFATDDELERVKSFFREKGIATAGGITLAAGGKDGQFGTFDYEDSADRAECVRAVRLIAKHFDEVILDDFFFYTSKSDADIAAKGKRSWTEYRLDKMREASRTLVLAPARAVNPRVRVIIKYPNWYEHFQGLGYDLDRQAQMFDGIYAGTETRDPEITDQLLQQYESYEIIRYFDNIRPNGGNGGGWVDTYDIRYIDRYAEQLWDTMLAKAPEITLFNWGAMASASEATAGERGWASRRTGFDWDEIRRGWRSSHKDGSAPGWARAAGAALGSVDAVLGELGRPTGLAAYKPYQSSGEDFLHNYLGNLGVPIELMPAFPAGAGSVLLTESAAADPAIVARVKAKLQAGGRVIVTSGFLQAMQGKGFEELAEWRATGRRVLIGDYIDGFGAGAGTRLNGEARSPDVLFPEIRFFTNDSWAIVRGVAAAKGFPMVLMNRYSNGTLYLWTMPENLGDLYNLPQPMVTRIKNYLVPEAPVRIDAPAHVALFTYDNGAFVVQNLRGEDAGVTISVAGTPAALREASSGARLEPLPDSPAPSRGPTPPPRRTFRAAVPAHSFLLFRPAA
jgi:hypothetical protein